MQIQLLGEREVFFPVGLKMMNFEERWFSPFKSCLQGMSKILWNGEFMSSMYVFFFTFILSLLVPILLCRLFLHHLHRSLLRSC